MNNTRMSSNNTNKLPESVINAVMQNDVLQLKQLREAGENFASCDENNNTLLHLAILSKSERELCKSGREFDRTHRTRAEVFSYLLTLNEVNKEAENNDQNTVLMDIFMYLRDSPDWAVELIKSGCDIYGEFRYGSTALHRAIYNGWDRVAELLIENGCEIDSEVYYFKTPLRLACELGFVNIVWMLLSYGADPNKGKCFDLIVDDCIKNEVKEIFLSLDGYEGYEKVFYLQTYMYTMQKSPELFYKLCDANGNVRYNTEDELGEFCTRLHRFKPHLFEIFVQKYDYVIRDMFEKNCVQILGNPKKDKNELEILATNILTILESDLVECVVNFCNTVFDKFQPRILCFVHWFFEHNELDLITNELDLITQVILSMSSYGVKIPAELMEEIYDVFGYCSLFKMLLHMDISIVNKTEYLEIVPRIFYDISLTPQGIVQYVEYFCRKVRIVYLNLYLIFDYFALPKLVKYCLDTHSEEIDEMEVIVKRTKKLPIVPKLVELARNKAREFIIHKYKIQTCGQFYTIIKWLPIANIYKEILTYERKLYE